MNQILLEFYEQVKQRKNIDINKIELAIIFAKEAHFLQFRKSGDEYIIHPISVAKILIEMGMDTTTIIAGILHDVVEDTLITIADIEYNFGQPVATLVEGVTKLQKLPIGKNKAAENIRKMIVAMAKDIRVIIVKLADRLHNMRTLKYMPEEKKERIAKETLKIYAPLAHRLGIAKIKSELEDLALYNLEPKKYHEIAKLINQKKSERERTTTSIINILDKELVKFNIVPILKGRAKHFYSIYQKMYVKNKNFEEIFDLTAVRIVVDTESECYNVLGVVHNLWKPVPGRFKDYIAMPKSNGYQSIHTTIFANTNEFVEIQIRTKEMNKIAENGVAAHWAYKEKKNASKSKNDVYGWLKNILEWQKETENTEEFIETVTDDIFEEEVFVFSPKGEVVNLKKNATPLDFAFSIHTQIGYKCVGAKINGKIVPIDYKLQNGDKVEIITSNISKGPSRDWLKIVVTSSSKNKIRKWFKNMDFDENVSKGKEIFEKAIIPAHIDKVLKTITMEKFLKRHAINSFDEFLFRVSTRKLSLEHLIEKVHEELNIIDTNSITKDIENKTIEDMAINSAKKNLNKSSSNIIIEDSLFNTEITLAKCCTPLPGDDISGYISRLKGIMIHRKDCTNFLKLVLKSPEKAIKTDWNQDMSEKKYSFHLRIKTIDGTQILQQIINIISEQKINISTILTKTIQENNKTIKEINLTILISGKTQGENIFRKIKNIENVISVNR